jgi:hypothetical protein
VPSAGEFGSQESADDFDGARIFHNSSAKSEDVGVIVLAAKARGGFIEGVGRTHAGNFIRGDGHSDACAADEDADFIFILGDPLGHRTCKIRIVHGLFRRSAHVVAHVSAFAQEFFDDFFQMKAGVVGSEGDTRLGGSLRHWADFIGGFRAMQIRGQDGRAETIVSRE